MSVASIDFDTVDARTEGSVLDEFLERRLGRAPNMYEVSEGIERLATARTRASSALYQHAWLPLIRVALDLVPPEKAAPWKRQLELGDEAARESCSFTEPKLICLLSTAVDLAPNPLAFLQTMGASYFAQLVVLCERFNFGAMFSGFMDKARDGLFEACLTHDLVEARAEHHLHTPVLLDAVPAWRERWYTQVSLSESAEHKTLCDLIGQSVARNPDALVRFLETAPLGAVLRSSPAMGAALSRLVATANATPTRTLWLLDYLGHVGCRVPVSPDVATTFLRRALTHLTLRFKFVPAARANTLDVHVTRLCMCYATHEERVPRNDVARLIGEVVYGVQDSDWPMRDRDALLDCLKKCLAEAPDPSI